MLKQKDKYTYKLQLYFSLWRDTAICYQIKYIYDTNKGTKNEQ